MKTFRVKHLQTRAVFEFTDDNPPEWLTSDYGLWFWTDHVLTLDVNESVNSRFHKITRLT